MGIDIISLAPHVPVIKTTREAILPTDRVQALMDAEVLCASLGIELSIRCHACSQVHRTPVYVTPRVNDAMTQVDIDCDCTRRRYRGTDLVAPPQPKMPDLALPLEDGGKHQVAFDRRTMGILDTFHAACKIMGLQYEMRCLSCRMSSQISDGIYGSRLSTATETVFECACTRRSYRGADAPMLQ